MRNFAILLAALLLCASCGKKKQDVVFYDTDVATEEVPASTTDETMPASSFVDDGSVVRIPYREEGGVKYLAVRVNGEPFDMIFDTGCSTALISVAEANYLYQKGRLAPEDIQGVGQSRIADGSIVENMVVNLREVIIGDELRTENVQATVASNPGAPLLLGNAVLDRATSVEIDTQNGTINFKVQ